MQMLRRRNALTLWIFISILCAYVAMAFADSSEDIPPPKAKFSEETICVEPIDIMRKRHFEFILEHRDETVIRGIRTTQYSLNSCIDCHITPNTNGEYAQYSDNTHFCASCHQFAAVSIDCFQCHADRPKEAILESLNNKQAFGTQEKKIHDFLELSDETAY